MPETTGAITDFVTNPRKNNEVFGLKVAGEEYIYSFPDKRGVPFDLDKVQLGSLVRLEHSPFMGKDGKTKNYVSVLECIGATPAPTTAPPTAELAQATPAAREWGYEQKDRLMCRESCAKSATTIFAASITAGIYKTHPNVSAVTAYAAALEEWCLRAID